MKSIVFLSHRIPYPPNKGDKIRSYNLLKCLTREFDVYLGTFVDNRADLEHVHRLTTMCKEVFARPLGFMAPRLRAVASLGRSAPLSLPFYWDKRMAEWVKDKLLTADLSAAVAYSSPMAQYIIGNSVTLSLPLVMDFVDVDSDKWEQYAAQRSGPMRWLYNRESRLLRKFEIEVTRLATTSTFVGEAEVEFFKEIAGIDGENVFPIRNGVNHKYFDPSLGFGSPYPEGVPIILFTGAMDYWANVDAVEWFATAVLPLVHKALPETQFWIVGSAPNAKVRQLSRRNNVVVTGFVDDVRKYLVHSSVVVAPLRIARGVQNKILEALACEKHVVCTTNASRGLFANDSLPLHIEDDATNTAGRIIELLTSRHANNCAGRQYVLKYYDWEANLAEFIALVRSATEAAKGDKIKLSQEVVT